MKKKHINKPMSFVKAAKLLQREMQEIYSEEYHCLCSYCMTDGDNFVAANRLSGSIFHHQGQQGLRSAAEYQLTLTDLTNTWTIVGVDGKLPC